MNMIEEMRANVDGMRAVAHKLLLWAEMLEQGPIERGTPDKREPPSREAVKAFLTNRCAVGYAAQVKDLIASFGAKTLSEVPDGSLAALMESAARLGAEPNE